MIRGRAFAAIVLTAASLGAQPSTVSGLHGRRPERLLIRGAMVVEGVGTPASGLLRELELQQEAGFHPLQVVKHATFNGALALGRENEIGRIRADWLADLVIVNGNPLANFKILYPVGLGAGKLEWTIKDGIPYHSPTLLEDARKLVARAR